jgi:hypothetical protein
MIKKIKEIIRELGPVLAFVGIIFILPLMVWFGFLIIEAIKEASAK